MNVAAAFAVATAVLLLLTAMGRARGRSAAPADDGTVRRRWSLPHLPRRRAVGVRPAGVAAWIDDIARRLRHGATLHAAIATSLPLDDALAAQTEPLRHWLSRGSSVTDACDEWADLLATSTVRRSELLVTTAAVMAATSTLGGASAAPLDRLAVAMRHRASSDLERSAHSAQAKLSARVLTLVPLAVLALLLATDADVRNVITQPRGAAVVALGLTLNAIGAWWMHRVANDATGKATA